MILNSGSEMVDRVEYGFLRDSKMISRRNSAKKRAYLFIDEAYFRERVKDL